MRDNTATAVALTTAAVAMAFSCGALLAAEEYDPKMSEGASRVDFEEGAFAPDPTYEDTGYNAEAQLEIYGGKTEVEAPRPLFELGQKQYVSGQLSEPSTIFGKLNPTQFAVQGFGDIRTAVAYNDNGASEVGQIATRLNLDVDVKLTSTERLHGFFRPFDSGNAFTRCEFAGGDSIDECDHKIDLNPETLFFEGDFGPIASGLTGNYYKGDYPFAVGLVPIFLANGIWANDAIIGGAYAIPSLNSPSLDISNMDFSFFAGFHDVENAAILDSNGDVADDGAAVYGMAAFFETREAYIEAGIGYVDADEDQLGDQDLISGSLSFSKRYRDLLSYSIRGVASHQDGPNDRGTGAALLLETSFMTSKPYTLVPYANLFAGVGNPQSLINANGLLNNTGINFETDGLTGFPAMDATAADAIGGAIGIQYLFNLDQQIVLELAAQHPHGNDSALSGDQYAIGLRWQLPVTKAWILRADAMYAINENEDDISGVRFEVRRKF